MRVSLAFIVLACAAFHPARGGLVGTLEIARKGDEARHDVPLSGKSWVAPEGRRAGGRWTDTPYQQQVWDATTRTTQWSVPNPWSNTPWLSMNEPRLMAHKTTRLRAIALHLRRRWAELRAEGQGHILLALNLDNEPVYWAGGNAGLLVSRRADADIAPAELEDCVRSQPPRTLYGSEGAEARPGARLTRARAPARQGQYAAACREAYRGLSAALPAAWYVNTAGRLSPHPLSVTTPEPGLVAVRRIERDCIIVELPDDAVCSAEVKVRGLRSGDRHRLDAAPRTARALRDSGGNLKVGADGVLSFSVSAAPPPRLAPTRQ